AGLLRAAALLPERPLEALGVDRLPALGRDQLREIERKAVRVVQLERLLARDDRRALELVEPLQAALDRFEEPLFLGPCGALDVRALFFELRVDAVHYVHDAMRQVHERGIALPQQPRVADG